MLFSLITWRGMHKFDNFSPPAVNSVDSLADSEVSI